MVRKINRRHQSRSRFPRPRGDGPLGAFHGFPFPTVSPPARGWSQLARAEMLRAAGFPARAGMVPWAGRCVSFAEWFPRPRGDGPTARQTRCPRCLVSPPARGWSGYLRHRKGHTPGFPARAGMVRVTGDFPGREIGFPRPRGDGPVELWHRAAMKAVSPPARGWSVSGVWRAKFGRGFPARAGMVPRRTGSGRSTRRFPRPRGDGPPSPNRSTLQSTVSPPARGWSVLALNLTSGAVTPSR